MTLPTDARIHEMRCRLRLLQQRFHQRRQVSRRAGRLLLNAFAQARHRLAQARHFHRFQQIVCRAILKGSDRVLVVRGDEHHMRAVANLGRHFEAGLAGHADIEECDVGLVRMKRLQRRHAIAAFGDHVQLRPHLGQRVADARQHHRFVVGNQCGGHAALPGRGGSWQR